MAPNTRPNGFADLRTDAELLQSGRPPKSVTFLKKLPLPPKFVGMLNASKLSSMLRGATMVAVSASSQALLNMVTRKGEKAVSNVQRASSLASLGASIVEETNPDNLRRPLRTGMSISSSQAAKSLSETVASSVTSSLISGVPIGSGVAPKTKIYKTLLSLKKSPRYFSGTGYPGSPTSSSDYAPIGSPSSVLVAQRGLLKDEIMYRLTLLAENVYAPLAAYAASVGVGPLVILEGFRAENTGISPHERGEAVDVTVGDGSLSQSSTLFQLAQWGRDHLLYDQLILCYSNIAGGQAWLHISFSPDANRRQVLTRPFNDAHVDGLHVYGVYTDADTEAQDRLISQHQANLSAQVAKIFSSRDKALNPVGVNTPTGTTGFSSTSSGTAPGDASGYVANTTLQTLVVEVVSALLDDPTWRALVGTADYDDRFIHEVVRRCQERGAPAIGPGALGINGTNGSTVLSRDTIAILNPTGTMGFNSWISTVRVQMVTILTSGDSLPQAAWTDVTVEKWGESGGFIPLNGDPVIPSISGDVPSAGEVQVLVDKYFAEESGQQRSREEWEIDYAIYESESTYDNIPIFHEEMQRAFRVTMKVARDLSTRYPQIGLWAASSGQTAVDSPEFGGAWFRHKGMLLSRSGPSLEILNGVGPQFAYSLDEEYPTPEECDRLWRSPFTGSA